MVPAYELSGTGTEGEVVFSVFDVYRDGISGFECQYADNACRQGDSAISTDLYVGATC